MAENLLRLQPGKALDQLQEGLHQQVERLLGIPNQEWPALQAAAGELGETLLQGDKFLGEPIRCVARAATEELSTFGNASTRALDGNVGGSPNKVIEGFANNFSMLGETNPIQSAF